MSGASPLPFTVKWHYFFLNNNWEMMANKITTGKNHHGVMHAAMIMTKIHNIYIPHILPSQ